MYAPRTKCPLNNEREQSHARVTVFKGTVECSNPMESLQVSGPQLLQSKIHTYNINTTVRYISYRLQVVCRSYKNKHKSIGAKHL